MKNTKKLLSLILTLVMIIGVVAPLSAFADQTVGPVGTIDAKNIETTRSYKSR